MKKCSWIYTIFTVHIIQNIHYMRFKLLSAVTLIAFLLTTTTIAAQKPVASSGLTLGQPVEKPTIIQGWKKLDATTNVPKVIYQTWARVNAGTPEAMAREYLGQHKSELDLTSADLANLDVYFQRSGGVGTTVRFRQSWQGVPVYGGEISLTVKHNRNITMVNNDFVPKVDLADVTPALTQNRARSLALDYVRPVGSVSDETQELVILPTGEGAKLAYRIVFLAMEPMGEWEVFVDAKNGTLLRVTDVAAYHKAATAPAYRPFPMLVEGTGNVFDPDPLSSAGATYGDSGYTDNNDNTTPELIGEQVSVTLRDITLDGGIYYLRGPYCEITDEESPNRGDFSQATNVWDFNRDDNAFEAVNVYYHIDASMRYLNETLGINVLPTDYVGGVKCDPSGLNNADNSHYVGSSQRLAWGDGGVDDAEDSDVIHHELGHGLHDWITGGGLSQNQGLSEGCGDYWAASYNRSLGDWTAADPQFNWIFNWDGHNEFWNGRSCGVATTWSQNMSGGIHTQGQVWSTSMMQVWDALGQQKTDIIFWEGIAMTGGSADQNDAANAVYQAALARPECTNSERLMVHTILTARGYVLPDFQVPVEWLSLSATPREKVIDLNWATATESGSDYYHVERSVDDGQNFTVVGRVAAAGFSSEINNYVFTDEQPVAGSNTYRIRQADRDGAFSYSDLVTVDFGGVSSGALAPNPTNGELYLRLRTTAATPFTVTVLDLQGREVKRINGVSEGRPFSVADLAKGVYLLRYADGGEMISRRFVLR